MVRIQYIDFKRNYYGLALRPINLLLITLSASFLFPATKAPSKHNARAVGAEAWADGTLKAMSLDEKVGQMLQVRFTGDYASLNSPDFLFVREQIEHYHIGSAVMGARMAGPNLIKGAPEPVAAIINELQRGQKIPLLIGADIERGLASRLSSVPDFPFPMAFGAVNDPAAAERFGRITAEEARAVGITWAYAPVADLNSNPQNPIINTRSFGDDPAAAGRLVAAYIRGAHQGGMMVAVKHFPGEGDTSTDPHARSTSIKADRAHLNANELVPFRAAIAAETDSVMLAQASVLAIDPDDGKVAATSSKVVDGLLRKELGFTGIVLTDALEMRGLTLLYPGDANPSGRIAIDAIKAGDDVLMLPRDLDGAFRAVVAAVRSGEIPETRIDASVRRILIAKAALGLNESRTVELNRVQTAFSNPDSDRFAQEVSDRAITLVRSNGHVLPMSGMLHAAGGQPGAVQVPATKKTVVITFTDSARSRLGKAFDREFATRDPGTRIFHFYNDLIGSDASMAQIAPLLQEADTVVIAPFLTHVGARQVPQGGGKLVTAVGFSGPGSQLFGDLLDMAPEKTVVVALGSPYLIEDFPQIQNYVCTYSLASTAEVSAVKALFGAISNDARLPIDLPGVAKRGFFLPWPRSALDISPTQSQTH